MAIIEKDGEGREVIKFEIRGSVEEHADTMKSIVDVFKNLDERTPVGKVAPIIKLLDAMLPSAQQLRTGM